MMFENRALKKIRGPKREVVTFARENCILRSFIIFTPCQNSWVIISRKSGMGGMWGIYGAKEK
jgi:hypothetical protein